MRRDIVVLFIILGAVFSLIFLPAILKTKKLFSTSPLEGKPPPEIKIGEKKLSEIINENKDKIILINFFASWCQECRKDREKFAKIKENGKFIVIGISFQDKKEKIEEYLKDINPYDFVVIDNGEISIDYGVTGVPETFIVENGIIKQKIIGPIE